MATDRLYCAIFHSPTFPHQNAGTAAPPRNWECQHLVEPRRSRARGGEAPRMTVAGRETPGRFALELRLGHWRNSETVQRSVGVGSHEDAVGGEMTEITRTSSAGGSGAVTIIEDGIDGLGGGLREGGDSSSRK